MNDEIFNINLSMSNDVKFSMAYTIGSKAGFLSNRPDLQRYTNFLADVHFWLQKVAEFGGTFSGKNSDEYQLAVMMGLRSHMGRQPLPSMVPPAVKELLEQETVNFVGRISVVYFDFAVKSLRMREQENQADHDQGL
jgi:hypothetical protein